MIIMITITIQEEEEGGEGGEEEEAVCTALTKLSM